MLHPHLIPKVLELKEKLAQFLAQFDREFGGVDSSSLWRTWHPLENPEPVSAADSSFNLLKRLGFYLVGVTAAAVPAGAPERVWGEFEVFPGAEDEDWLRFFLRASSGVLEAKAWVWLRDRGTVLVDGALSVAARRLRDELGLPRALRWAGSEDEGLRRRLERLAEEMAPEVRKEGEGLLFWGLLKDVESVEEDKGFRRALLTLLAREEYRQALLRFLLGANALAVAKTSSDTSLAEELGLKGVPDIYLLSKITQNPGFTEPRPVKGGLGLEGLEAPLSFFYARLERGRGVVRVEVIAKPEEVDPERVLATLLATVRDGYPYPLAKAHELCTLPYSALERVLELAGAKGEPSGREGL